MPVDMDKVRDVRLRKMRDTASSDAPPSDILPSGDVDPATITPSPDRLHLNEPTPDENAPTEFASAEEVETKKAAKAAAEAGTETPSTPGAAPTDTPPAEPAWTPPTKEQWDAHQQKATDYDRFQQEFLRAPELLMEQYFRVLTPQQQQVYLQRLAAGGAPVPGMQTPPEAHPFANFDQTLATDAEKYVVAHQDWIGKGAQQFSSFVQEAQQAFLIVRNEAEMYDAAQALRVQAVAELLGAKFPDLDINDVATRMRAGKDVRTAVSESYGPSIKAVVDASKAASKPTPKTPGNGSGRQQPLPQGADMAQIMSRLLGRPLSGQD